MNLGDVAQGVLLVEVVGQGAGGAVEAVLEGPVAQVEVAGLGGPVAEGEARQRPEGQVSGGGHVGHVGRGRRERPVREVEAVGDAPPGGVVDPVPVAIEVVAVAGRVARPRDRPVLGRQLAAPLVGVGGLAGGVAHAGETPQAEAAGRRIVVGPGHRLGGLAGEGRRARERPIRGVVGARRHGPSGVARRDQVPGGVVGVLGHARDRRILACEATEIVVPVGRGVAVGVGHRGEVVGCVIGVGGRGDPSGRLGERLLDRLESVESIVGVRRVGGGVVLVLDGRKEAVGVIGVDRPRACGHRVKDPGQAVVDVEGEVLAVLRRPRGARGGRRVAHLVFLDGPVADVVEGQVPALALLARGVHPDRVDQPIGAVLIAVGDGVAPGQDRPDEAVAAVEDEPGRVIAPLAGHPRYGEGGRARDPPPVVGLPPREDAVGIGRGPGGAEVVVVVERVHEPDGVRRRREPPPAGEVGIVIGVVGLARHVRHVGARAVDREDAVVVVEGGDGRIGGGRRVARREEARRGDGELRLVGVPGEGGDLAAPRLGDRGLVHLRPEVGPGAVVVAEARGPLVPRALGLGPRGQVGVGVVAEDRLVAAGVDARRDPVGARVGIALVVTRRAAAGRAVAQDLGREVPAVLVVEGEDRGLGGRGVDRRDDPRLAGRGRVVLDGDQVPAGLGVRARTAVPSVVAVALEERPGLVAHGGQEARHAFRVRLVLEAPPRRRSRVKGVVDRGQIVAVVVEGPSGAAGKLDTRQVVAVVAEGERPAFGVGDRRQVARGVVGPGDPVAPAVGGRKPAPGGRVVGGHRAVEVGPQELLPEATTRARSSPGLDACQLPSAWRW